MSRQLRSVFLLSIALITATYIINKQPYSPIPPKKTRFVKIAEDGKILKPWQGPWSCVLDTKTNLIWEVKNDKENIHDFQCSFSWYDGNIGIKNAGSCYEISGIDTNDLVQYTNHEHFCGREGWRVPHEVELRTLVEPSSRPGEPMLATDFFPYAKHSFYWTSEAELGLQKFFQKYGKGALGIDFSNGRTLALPYQNNAFVRLVSTTQITK